MSWIAGNWAFVAGGLVALGTVGGWLETSKVAALARAGAVMAGIGTDLLSVGRGLFGAGK